MGCTTEDPMFDPRQFSRPDSCLLGCDDVSWGVSQCLEGNIFYLKYLASEDEGTSRLETSALAQRKVTPQKTRILKNTTVGISNVPLSRPALGATEPANSVGRRYASGHCSSRLGETYLCCVRRLWIGRNNTHDLINIVIRLQSRTSSFRIWHKEICVSIPHNFWY